MSREREQKLFDAITLIRDDLVEDAQNGLSKPSRPAWRVWAAAACAVLAVGLGVWRVLPLLGGSAGGGDGAGGGAFLSYAGPVLPLTIAGEAEGLTAERAVTYGLSLPSEDSVRVSGAGVEDSYLLTNHTAEDRTVTALYPFASSFQELETLIPAVTVDGASVQPALRAGAYGENRDLKSWEEYQSLLATGNDQAGAHSSGPTLDQRVTVYEFTDFDAPWEEYPAATQAISFHIDPEKTAVLSYGFNGYSWDEKGDLQFSYFAPDGSSGRPERKVLLVLGDDLGSYALRGYQDGGRNPGDEIDGVSAAVTRREAALSDVTAELTSDFFAQYGGGALPPGVPPELFAGMLARSLVQSGVLDYQGGGNYVSLEDFISDVNGCRRVLYLEFPVTIPAGGSAAVTARLHKDPSRDYAGARPSKADIQGYDLAVSLGSNLPLTSLTAELTHAEHIEVVNQNFGFDLPGGVSKVSLDPAQERYYFELKPLEQ